jgi:hypothetical protein
MRTNLMSTLPEHLYLVGSPFLPGYEWSQPERVELDEAGQVPAHIAAAIGRGQSTGLVGYIREDVAQADKEKYASLLLRAVFNAKSEPNP